MNELTFDEWREVIDQARALGTNNWAISGGEPMLRPDFPELFEYVTARARWYSLNTNGTLITLETARLLRRKGSKMVAVYGATSEVYDRVTRNPGGFEALLEGLARLREAGVSFIIQLIPMSENRHQWGQMVQFAKRWGSDYRVGAPWLYKTDCGDPARNAEIERMRLDPADVVRFDHPVVSHTDAGRLAGFDGDPDVSRQADRESVDNRLYAECIDVRRDFHVDPYGSMSFCCFVKDPTLRYDLRQGKRDGIEQDAVRKAWEEFIPSRGNAVRGGPEYAENCGGCDLRRDCHWCDAYGYLEHRRHGAKVDHLCAVARETRVSKERWVSEHTRYYEIAGITVQVESDIAFDDRTFAGKFQKFRVDEPGSDTVVIRHHFGLPDLKTGRAREEVYRRPPWAIYREGRSWVYEEISPSGEDSAPFRVAVFSANHCSGHIFHAEHWRQDWRKGGIQSLTMFPTDQILLARLLADREGCILHSSAIRLNGQGLLFVGHSDAGKSTTIELVRNELGERAEILCDDRNVVRRWPEGFRVHGTWSHGDVPEVSAASAPLRAVLFLEQHERNEIVPLCSRKEEWQRLLSTLIKPLMTADWWHKEIDVLEQLVAEVPLFIMRFDKSGAIVAELSRLVE